MHWHLNKSHDNSTLESQDFPPSVGDFFQERIDKFISDESDERRRRLKRGFCDWFWKWELVDTGVSDLKQQSVRSWIEYVDYDMDNKFDEGEPILEGGYSKLVEFLLTSLHDRATLLTNRKCRKILWNTSEKVKVALETGEVYEGDAVIVALPLGVLKHDHQTMFEPSLPSQKIEIIEQLEFGLMNKIFLEFDEMFWDSDNPGLQFIMTEEAEVDLDNLADTWMRAVAGFDSVCGQPRVLCGWINGDAAAYMETLTNDQILDTCWSLLRKYVGGHVPRPATCHPSRWGCNPNIRGSYSYTTPACDTLALSADDLAAPVTDKHGKERIFFCGEVMLLSSHYNLMKYFQASDRTHYGTVTGAMVSGVREGVRLSKLLSLPEQHQ